MVTELLHPEASIYFYSLIILSISLEASLVKYKMDEREI